MLTSTGVHVREWETPAEESLNPVLFPERPLFGWHLVDKGYLRGETLLAKRLDPVPLVGVFPLVGVVANPLLWVTGLSDIANLPGDRIAQGIDGGDWHCLLLLMSSDYNTISPCLSIKIFDRPIDKADQSE